jgi:hypothetical protein
MRCGSASLVMGQVFLELVGEGVPGTRSSLKEVVFVRLIGCGCGGGSLLTQNLYYHGSTRFFCHFTRLNVC